MKTIKIIGVVIGTILTTLLLTYPGESSKILINILTFNNSLLLKALLSFFLFYNFSSIQKNIKKLRNLNKEVIEGIPIIELVDFLFENKSFKRDDIEKTFGIPRNRYEKLAKKFDDLNILIRGNNNSRILNEDFTRQEIFKILSGNSKASELKNYFMKISNNFFIKAGMLKNEICKKFEGLAENNSEHVFLESRQNDGDFVKKDFTLDLSRMCGDIKYKNTTISPEVKTIKIENRQMA